VTDPFPTDPQHAYAELARIDLAENDLTQVLDRVAELVARTIPGADAVSVTLLQDGGGVTAAFTHDVAVRLDETQYGEGSGPCLAAAASGETLVVDEMTTDRRWPAFAADAQAQGVASSMSVGLPLQKRVRAALNIYGERPRAFDDAAVELGRTFAGYAATVLANAHLYSSTAAFAEQMRTAMATRAVIEQAKGVLVAQEGCTPEQAFELLVRASQAGNRKLRDVAAATVAAAQKNAD
jgi:GAF domain-containing protein